MPAAHCSRGRRTLRIGVCWDYSSRTRRWFGAAAVLRCLLGPIGWAGRCFAQALVFPVCTRASCSCSPIAMSPWRRLFGVSSVHATSAHVHRAACGSLGFSLSFTQLAARKLYCLPRRFLLALPAESWPGPSAVPCTVMMMLRGVLRAASARPFDSTAVGQAGYVGL